MSRNNKKPSKRSAVSHVKYPSGNLKNNVKQFYSEIILFHKQGNYQKSLDLSQQALKFFPNDINLLSNAGALAHTLKQLNLAKEYYQKTLKLKPNDFNAHCNLATLLKDQKQFEEAIKHYKKALKINPSYAVAHNNLALLFKEQKKFEMATKHYQEAIRINTNYAEAYYNLAILLEEQKRFIEAKEYYQKALEISPNYADAHNNFGTLLEEQKEYEKAVKHYKKALENNPNCIDTYNNLASTFKKQKKFEKTINYYKKALEINPNCVDTQFHLSLLKLNFGEFNKGFEFYEFRYHENRENRNAVPPTISTPQYQSDNPNQDLASQHILIIPEQGIGDEVMFASVLPELSTIVQQNPSTKITLACDPRLVEIFNHSFDFLTAIPKDPDNRYADLEKDLDYWLFIGSLPKFYRNDIKDFYKHQPYLTADKMLFSIWKNRFNNLEHDISIGISWRGGAKAEHKQERSLTLKQLTPILTQASQTANIINLQYGDHAQEIDNFTAQIGITIHDWDDADPFKDLDNFSSQIKALDLVISIDNSTLHFAGALGTKTFVMLPFNQDWRWAEERTDSYWYPNIMTLFRQTKDGEWEGVIQDVTNALESAI